MNVTIVIAIISCLTTLGGIIFVIGKWRGMEENHLPTIEKNIETFRKDSGERLGQLRDDVAKIYDKLSELQDRVSRIEGKINGYNRNLN